MKKYAPQLLPAPKGKTFWEKINKEAETFEQQNLEVTHQPFSFLNPKSQALPIGPGPD
jgi:hypothetical protein